MVRVGDFFEIPLSNNRKAFGQFVYKELKNGPMIQVYDLIVQEDDPLQIDFLKLTPLFPPIITGLNAAIREGLWHKIGKYPINSFAYPLFISAHWSNLSKQVINWFLWNGENYIELGPELPEKY